MTRVTTTREKNIFEVEDDGIDSSTKPLIICRGIHLWESDKSALNSEELTDFHIDLA